MPHPIGWGHNALTVNVRPSVCPMSEPKLRMEGRRKMKTGKKESGDTCDPWSHLEAEGGKFWCHTACVFYRDVDVQWMISVIWPSSRKLLIVVQVSTCRVCVCGHSLLLFYCWIQTQAANCWATATFTGGSAVWSTGKLSAILGWCQLCRSWASRATRLRSTLWSWCV